MTTKATRAIIENAKSRSRRVGEAVNRAMATISGEIRENGKIYPHNGGRLSMAEVCRRAGVDPITLHGLVHRDTTRKAVQDWLKKLKVVRGTKQIKSAVTKRAVVAKEELKRVASQFQAMYQIEIPKRDAEIARLTSINDELTKENALLAALVTDRRVVSLSEVRSNSRRPM